MIYPEAARLIESKKPDELDIEFEGIAEPKMKLVEYDELRDYLLSRLRAADIKLR